MSISNLHSQDNVMAKVRFNHFKQYLQDKNIDVLNSSELMKKIGKESTLVNWIEFEIQPTIMSRTYKILMVYVQGYPPYAYILSPSLEELHEPELKIPHLYDYERYRLCLYYPHLNEYNSKEEIGEQFIPWIQLWLYYFEEWLSSKEWKGEGVEPDDEIDREYNPKHKTKDSKVKKLKKKMPTALDEANKVYARRVKNLMKDISIEKLN
jgi:hypothetical protein